MRRLLMIAALSSVVTGCPQPVDSPQDAIRPADQVMPQTQAPGLAPASGTGTSDQMDVPPGMNEVPADQKQRAIGALNADAVAKAAILDYVAKNGQNGSLSFDDGQGGTVTAQFLRTHDPVRYKEGKGYIGLSGLPGIECGAQCLLPVGVLDEEERQ